MMLRRFAPLLAVLALLPGAAIAAKAHRPPAAAAAKAPTAKPGPTASAFDSGDPANWARLLAAVGATAKPGAKQADSVLLAVTSTAANFSIQFAQCAPDGRACKAALFDTLAGGAPSLSQLNGFNQASAMCRGYLDRAGKPHVTLSALLFPDESEGHAAMTLAAWQGCVADFSAFAKDPVAYLAAAP